MSQTVIILGARGRFGRAASQAFLEAGWNVRLFARNWAQTDDRSDFEYHVGDAVRAEDITKAALGCDVIVNALNPPYQKWARVLPQLTKAVINAAKATRATIMLPGNVYNYGAAMPPILTEDTPHRPTTRKGQLREAMEEDYAIAADLGVQTVILRAGDFIEQSKTGNWFDTYIANKVDQGRVTYPGPLDRVHAWAYLPDMAQAMVGLAQRRAELGPFSTFGYEGYNLTGAQLISAMEDVSGRDLRVSKMQWPIMGLLAAFMPTIREVMEMRYLWDVPHALNGEQLSDFLADHHPTPLKSALADALGQQLQPETRTADYKTA